MILWNSSLKGPILRIEAILSVMNSIANEEAWVFGVKEDMDRLVLIARYEIEMVGFGELVDREYIPE